jgi:hypothetical protein
MDIAGARQIFHKNFFFSSFYKETSLGSEKKNIILKNLPGDCNINIVRPILVAHEIKGRYKTGGTGQLYDGFPDCEWKMNTP